MEFGGKDNPTLLRVPRLSSPATLKRRLLEQAPQIHTIANCEIDLFLNRDSAHVGPGEWLALAKRIQSRWRSFDGVVVLHGTDTMPYTACALSFLLRPCLKPVVLTGAQLPLAAPLTDARRNFLSAIEIAAHGPRNIAGRVSILFDDVLLQGNRARKTSAESFGAFKTPGLAPLAEVGTSIRYLSRPRAAREKTPPRMNAAFNPCVLLLQVTPGFPSRIVNDEFLSRINRHEGALVLSVFGSGTAPTNDSDFIGLLREARQRGIPVVAVSESQRAGVESGPHVYEAGRALLREGCHWAGRMTPECAYVKTAWIAAQAEARSAGGFGRLWKREFAEETH